MLVAIHEHDGRNAQQVEQVDTDTKAGKERDEHEPAVAVRLVGTLLPLEYQPEHYRREHGRVGVNLSLDRAEPERVAERIGQRAYYARTYHFD